MKKLYLLLLMPFLTFGQAQNYVRSTTYKVANGASFPNPTATQATVQVTFFDGLGRPIQQVAHKQASNGGDIIVPIEYDNFGRQLKEYLPYVRNTAALTYDPAGLSNVASFYASNNIQNTANPGFASTLYPYSEKQLEPSPLNRVLKQAAPGEVWHMNTGREIKFDYLTNAANEVRYFKAHANWDTATELYLTTLTDNTFYSPNELYKTITKDENWEPGSLNHTTEEFKNKLGQVVLKRTYTDITATNGAITQQVQHDTYYVYDDYGNLTYVIPPLVTTTGSVLTTDLDGLCYQYRYDVRNRLVEKKLPGKEWEFIVYDKLDRPVYTGPALNPFDGLTTGWNVTKYDEFGRVAYTGWLPDTTINSAKRKSLQTSKNSETFISEGKIVSDATLDGVTIRYSNKVLPTADLKLLTITYYDTYSYPSGPSIPSPIMGQTVRTNVKGLVTGAWVRVLNATVTPVIAERSYSFYDSKGRAIRSYTLNHLGGHTQTDMQVDFVGQVLATTTSHKRSSSDATIVTNEYFEYTGQGKLSVHYHQINGGEMERITLNQYDNLGQLITKDVGGSPSIEEGLQKINYEYNIRGWLTQINNMYQLQENPGQYLDLFAFQINYDDVQNSVGGEVRPLFNGNISETFWITQADGVIRKYGYKYDQLNRLQRAIYQKPGQVNPITNSYNESLWYDKNGNISRLHRTGELDDVNYIVTTDDLQYSYHSTHKNRLMKVYDIENNPNGFKDDVSGTWDSVDDYDYDDFGNMTKDDNKGISRIYYNHLNLPIKIVQTLGTIEYLYNAIGVKVQKKVTKDAIVATTDYQSGYQYVNGQLLFFPHAEGYVNVTEGTVFNYVYNYTDHLGNVRVSFGYDPHSNDLKILEENHYYPFGLKHKNYNVDKKQYGIINQIPQIIPVTSLDYKYKYNGKEFQDELGLNWYDYQARNYDPALGRWMNIDPLAETSRRWSPYTYCYNNPMIFVDPDGMQAKKINPIDENAKKAYNEYKESASAEKKKELQALEDSDTVYNISVSSDNKSHTTYNFDTNEVDIQIQDVGEYTIGIVADELTHASQFENGEIGFEEIEYKGKTYSVTTNYDLKDEVDSKNAMIDALATKGLKMENIPGNQDGPSAAYGRLHTENNGNLTDKQIEKWSGIKHPIEKLSYKDIIKSSGGSTIMSKTTKPENKIKRL